MAKVCPHCGATNRDTARFCQGCARPLVQEVICPACGAANVPAARLCHQCGKVLLSGGPVMSPGTGLLSANTLLNNRYLILEKVGQGGMGAVYKASDTRLGQKPVAVKELSEAALSNPLDRQQARQSFEQEAQLLAKLSHPNLPRVTDHFSEAGKQYLVMDFIDGKTLQALLDATHGPLAVKQVVDWACQLCDVLDYLHGQQPPVIFRDLKPTNIMLDRDGKIKLIDFGIARHFKAGKTSDTTSFGTAGYAPPEQYGKGQTDARSDIYALGATLHHLLTGRDPADNPFNFTPLRSLNPKVPEAVEHAVMKAVEQDAANRWQNAREMKQALTAPPPVPAPQPVAVAQTPATSPAYMAPASPVPVAVPVPARSQAAPSPALVRAGFMAWLALAVGIYAVYLLLLPFIVRLGDPDMQQVARAAIAAMTAPLLFNLSRRAGSGILMGLLLLTGVNWSAIVVPSVTTMAATLAAPVAVELVFAIGGYRKFGFWTTILAAAAGSAAGWAAPQLPWGGSLSFESIDAFASKQLVGALLGGLVAFLAGAAMLPQWWRSGAAIRGRLNYVQVAFVAVACVAFVSLIRTPAMLLIAQIGGDPNLRNFAMAALNGLALPLAFMIAQRPGTALFTNAVRWLFPLLAGAASGDASLTAVSYLAGALAFELVFLVVRYRRFGFWRLVVASGLNAIAGLQAGWLMRSSSLYLQPTLIYLAAGAALAGAIAYLIGKLVRK